jgi:hypothetical protein
VLESNHLLVVHQFPVLIQMFFPIVDIPELVGELECKH